MFERFTDRARRVVVLAQEEARTLGHNYIGTEHLLLGLLMEGEGVGAKALEGLGIHLQPARSAIQGMLGRGGPELPEGHIPFTPRAKTVLELSLREALQLGHNYIGTEHLLLALVREGQGAAAQVLVKMGASLDRVRTMVVNILSGYPSAPRQAPVRLEIQHRFSPGLAAALEAAEARAAETAAIGTHHVLSVFAEWGDLAAFSALEAGGFDRSVLETPIQEWDVSGTRDETDDEWGRRVTDVETETGEVVIRLRDPSVSERVRRAIEAGSVDDVKAAFGRIARDLESRLPPEASLEPGDDE